VIEEYKNHDPILLAVDCIIFGFDGFHLKALLIKRSFEPGLGKWSLMGGFIKREESVDAAAARVLFELTGLHHIYMEQVKCFGEVNRDPGGRVVSIVYFALIKINGHNEELMNTYHAKWFDLGSIRSLIFDHKKMIQSAKKRLQELVANHPIGFELLPKKFTLQQLQLLYEAIYGTKLDTRNFVRKILSFNILRKLDEKEKQTSRKGAYLYVFDKNNYKKLEKEGLEFM
jgi:ADP-ribose pyrophosphatase YjhB (NUDIX family)